MNGTLTVVTFGRQLHVTALYLVLC